MPDFPPQWSPAAFLSETSDPYALIILNQSITDLNSFRKLWRHASYKIAADGGANRLHELNLADFSHGPIPSVIIGDLDSIRPSVEYYFQEQGVPIIKDEDQYATDFTKCLKWLDRQPAAHASDPAKSEQDNMSKASKPPSGPLATNSQYTTSNTFERNTVSPLQVYILNALGGRVDHSFHSLHQLFVASSLSRRILLVSPSSITFLLSPGMNIISTPLAYLGPTCGIIPIDGAATITTSGLEWDLKSQETRMGGMVSSSNHLTGEEVIVNVEKGQGVVFTVEIRDPQP